MIVACPSCGETEDLYFAGVVDAAEDVELDFENGMEQFESAEVHEYECESCMDNFVVHVHMSAAEAF